MIREEVLLVGGTNDGARAVVVDKAPTIVMHVKDWSESALDALRGDIPPTGIREPKLEEYRRVEVAPASTDYEYREVVYVERSVVVTPEHVRGLWARSRRSR